VSTLVPRTANEVTDAIRWAATAGEPLEVIASATRRALGRPVDAPHVLDVSSLRGVLTYEPEELILTALPGTSVEEIEALLAARGQCLAFEPPDFTALLSREPIPDKPTLGGMVATGLSGPRRPKAGAVRDHVLGIAAASGRGEFFMAGGKVVKNVTGYDLPKLITGSYGTLAVLTEITLKVLPAPETTRTLLIEGLTPQAAVATMTSVLQTSAETSGACHLPTEIRVTGKPSNTAVTALRLEGVVPSVDFRLDRLRERVADKGPVRILERDESLAFWREVRDAAPFAHGSSQLLWRISVPPAQGALVLDRITRDLPAAEFFLDWGGGLIWVQLGAPPDATPDAATALAATEKIRAAVATASGHATLVRASADVRRVVQVFQPQPAGLAALSNRVRAQFDPKHVLNPGRLYLGV
jgi:glycolate oxidase FAD binding subunit